LRVVAGALGGRRLTAPRGLETRPTSDRVREALFSALGDLAGARVLDLFAGTGALGIEALSRGATHAIFVENARAALAALRENLATLDLTARTRIIAQPVASAVAALGGARARSPNVNGPFDLVFVDPPYAVVASLPPILAELAPALAPEARLVLEHAAKDPPPAFASLVAGRTRIYGSTAVTTYAAS